MKYIKKAYYYFRLIVLSFFKCLFRILPIQKNKIVFDNFNGKCYGDNPKYITEEIIRRKLNFDLVWLLKDSDDYYPKEVRIVKPNTIKAMYELATAKVWVDNIRSINRPRKRKKQIYLQTWHSSLGFKKLEQEIEHTLNKTYVKKAKIDGRETNGIISSSKIQDDLFERAFWLDKNAEILKIGAPRNDYIINNMGNKELIDKIRKSLLIEDDKTIILYAPTFRDDFSTTGYIKDIDRVKNSFEKSLKKECVILVRMHPNVIKQRNLYNYDNNIIDVSDYPDMQELSLISDVIITDYSSAFYDFLLQKKIIIFYAKDFKEYQSRRNLKSDYENMILPLTFNENELIETITNLDIKNYEKLLKEYSLEYPMYDDGQASIRAVEWILNKIK